MIVAIIGKKGGCGKSTIATHLAGWRQRSGSDTMLIDADRQATATLWAQTRTDLQNLPVPGISQSFDRAVRTSARNLARHYSDIIIDVAGGDETSATEALRIADVTLIPFQPAELDIWTTGAMEDLIDIARDINDHLRALALINRAPTNPRSKDPQRAQQALGESEVIQLTDILIRDRSSIRRCVPAGFLIDEWKPHDSKAIEELAQAYTVIFNDSIPSYVAPPRTGRRNAE